MSEIQKLARMMQELEEQVIVCMRCGMCQAVCPVYKQTGKEERPLPIRPSGTANARRRRIRMS